MYEYWLARIQKIASGKKRKLRAYFQCAEAIYYIEEKELCRQAYLKEKEVQVLLEAKREQNLRQAYEHLLEGQIRFIPYFSEAYPNRLRQIASPPYALYVRGQLPDSSKYSAAIVGARRCTPYGEQYAREYGRELSHAGISVISGMARGIDGAGHRGALNAGGPSFAVLGCGVDVCYPKEHQGLYRDLQEQGGVLSEYPPGTPPLSGNFPARNRIISGLSDVVLIMEAKEKSGSLITADMALEQGKDVYALPGPVTSALSQGCHQLIRQGAGILISPQELLMELGIPAERMGQNSDKNEKMLESPENMVYSCLDLFPKGIHQLLRESGLAPGELMEHLVTLQLAGKIQEISKNYYVKNKNCQRD